MPAPLDEFAKRAVRDLASADCPGCRGEKRRGQSVCGACYAALPRGVRVGLHSPLRNGYERYYALALRHLGAMTQEQCEQLLAACTERGW